MGCERVAMTCNDARTYEVRERRTIATGDCGGVRTWRRGAMTVHTRDGHVNS